MTPRPVALVVADGEVPTRAALDAAWPGWADGVRLVIAADGGAEGAAILGLAVDLLVGDLDSLPPERVAALRAGGTAVVAVAAEKDESDTELALLAALERGARSIVVVGAFGGPRLDHALANVGLLTLPALAAADADAVLIDGRTRVSALVAPGPDGGPTSRELVGRAGDLVSLLPLGAEAIGVTTAGLRYPLADEPLLPGPARGLSNLRVGTAATVTLRRGRLVVVETTGILPA